MTNNSTAARDGQLQTDNSPIGRRVAHLPCYGVNPYQHLLMESLNGRGFETIDGGGGGNFFRSALVRWKAKNIHLHWLHPYIVRKTWFASVLRGTRLVLELAVLKLCGKRIFWTVHNIHNHQGQFRNVERNACRWIAWLANGVLCHSNFAADAASKAYGVPRTKILVSPHPIWQRHHSSGTRADARASLSVGDSDCVILFFGRVAPYKGLEDLIGAFSNIPGSNVRLVIAGGPQSPEYREKIESMSQADGRITLTLRFIEDEEVAPLMRAADVVVFPFKEILTSGSLLLAMEFGKSCIAPAIGAVPETLPAEQQELTYDPADGEALEKTLWRAVELGSKRDEIGEANRRHSENWTWDRLADDCIQLYNGSAVWN